MLVVLFNLCDVIYKNFYKERYRDTANKYKYRYTYTKRDGKVDDKDK